MVIASDAPLARWSFRVVSGSADPRCSSPHRAIAVDDDIVAGRHELGKQPVAGGLVSRRQHDDQDAYHGQQRPDADEEDERPAFAHTVTRTGTARAPPARPRARPC